MRTLRCSCNFLKDYINPKTNSQIVTYQNIMSWYLFKDVPSVNHRGIKVEGFQDMHRPKLNLSWGIASTSNPSQTYEEDKNIVPTTILPPASPQNENINNIKVLTETSEDEEEELAKLIKNQQEQREKRYTIERNIKLRNRGLSLWTKKQNQYTDQKQQKTPKHSQIEKKIRYLENSLLPINRRDNMRNIFDHSPDKEQPLNQSRVSGRSYFSKKNQSSIVLGNGYNVYSPLEQPKKDLTSKLKEMYEYDELYKKRMDRQNFKLG